MYQHIQTNRDKFQNNINKISTKWKPFYTDLSTTKFMFKYLYYLINQLQLKK